MVSREFRSFLPLRNNGLVAQDRASSRIRHGGSRLASLLAAKVGRAFGVDGRSSRIERLEERALLDGSPANPLPLTAGTEGRFTGVQTISSPTDVDYFEFIAPANAFVGVLADTSNEANRNLDSIVRVSLASTGTVIATGADNGSVTSGFQKDGWAGFLATAGTRYIIEVAGQAATSGPYTLRIRGTNFTFSVGGVDNRSTPPGQLGIGFATGTPTPTINPNSTFVPGGSILGQLGGTGPTNSRIRQDEYIYRWTAPNEARFNTLVTLNAQSTEEANLSTRLDTHIDLYDQSGTLITSDQQSGRINDAALAFRATAGQTYYIRVRADEVSTQNIQVATGPFFLLFDAQPDLAAVDRISRRFQFSGQFLNYDAPLNVPSPNIPTPIFQNQAISFVSEGTGTAIISVTGALPTITPLAGRGAGFLTNPAVSLYNDRGDRLAFADDVFGLNPQLIVQLVGGERYFLVVDGFELNAGQAYNLFAEVTTTLAAVFDDHPDAPTAGDTLASARRNASEATAIPFSDPFVTLDADANLVRDRGLRVTGVADGRLEPRTGSNVPDTDLFQFTAPADMLLNYNGNNNDAGTSLFLGGSFDTQDLGSQFPGYSRGVTGFDGGDWFAVGRQNIVTVNGVPVQQGFIDNPATPNTNGPVIYASFDWEPFQGEGTALPRRLVIGGDFIYQEVLPNGAIVQISNLIVWQNIAGRYQWNRGQGPQFLGNGTNGPVFALAQYNPTAFDPDDAGPAPTIQDPSQSDLYIGGEFTNSNGTVAANLARFNPILGWRTVPADPNLDPTLETASGPVRAFAVYDAPDAGAGRAFRAGTAGPPPEPTLNVVLDPGNPPQALYIGGSFGQGLIGWNGNNRFTLSVGSVPISGGFPTGEGTLPPIGNIDGSVYSLATYTLDLDNYIDADGTNLDPTGDPLPPNPGPVPPTDDEPVRLLLIGGDFSGRDGMFSPGLLGWGAVRPAQDPEDVGYSPALEFLDLGLPIAGTVHALQPWLRASLTQGIDPVEVLVLGGAFSIGNIANLGTFTNASLVSLALGTTGGAIGTDGPVFSLAAYNDTEELLEEAELDSGSANDTLYIGGDFGNILFPFPGTPLAARNVAYINAVTGQGNAPPNDSFSWGQLGANGVEFQTTIPGRPSAVRTLVAFDDGLANSWDRNDRPASRLALELTGTFNDQADFQIRVLDSNFNQVFPAGSLTGGFSNLDEPPGDGDPDNPGFRDPSLGRVDRNINFDGISVVGGQVYYIVVQAAGGTGRYSLSLTADAGPRRVQFNRDNTLTFNNTLAPADVNTTLANLPRAFAGNRDDITPAPVFEESLENDFNNAIRRQLFGVSNDADLSVLPNTATSFNESRHLRENPSQRSALFLQGSQGLISSIDDTDLYFFRAAVSGTAEIRLSTSRITDSFAFTRTDYRLDYPPIGGAGAIVIDGAETPINPYESNLDAALRIYSNDFSQIAYNDENPALGLVTNGDRDTASVIFNALGQQTINEFNRRDPRVVFPIIANQVYFIQVESAQRWRIPNPVAFYDNIPDPVDPRTLNADPEIDWRYATGSYQLLFNTQGDQFSDVENGQIVTDDHVDVASDAVNAPVFATPIRVGSDPQRSESDGIATISGFINNTPAKPIDFDTFKFVAPAEGDFVINFVRAPGSTLIADLIVSTNGINLGQPTNLGNGTLQLVSRAVVGQEFFIQVNGVATSEGAYFINIQTAPSTDDFGDKFRWWEAADIDLEDASGSGFVAGRLETSDDTDIFRFDFPDWDFINVTVRPVDGTLRPRVTVYEVSEIPVSGAGAIFHPFHLQIASSSRTVAPAVGADVTVRASVQPERTTRFPAPNNRSYPFYYVVVEGFDPQADVGRYELSISFSSTDDHPDAADIDNNDTYDISQFDFASRINIDPFSGSGASNGVIEVLGDTDLFTFEVPASGPVTVNLTRALSSGFRGRVSILDASGVLLGTRGILGDDGSTAPVSAFVPFVARGTRLFIVIEPVAPNTNTTQTGAYSVNVIAPSVDDHANQNEFSLATPIFILASNGRGQLGGSTAGQTGNPRINSAADTDLFYFFSVADGSHTVTITPLSGNTLGLRPSVQVFQAVFNTQGTETGQVLLGSFDAASALGEAIFTFNVPAPLGKYYILVLPLPGANTITPAQYRVAVQGPIPTVQPPGQDTGEIDFNAPTTIVLNDRTGDGSTLRQGLRPQLPEINPSGDRDLYSFTTLAPGRVFVRLALPDGSTLLGRIDVFRRNPDTSIVAIGSDEINNFGSAARIDFAASAGQEFLVIVDAPGDSTGSYILEVDTQPVVNRLVYPEGYSTNLISEFIPIVNPNPFPISYTVKLYYSFADENGDRLIDTFDTRIIGASARDGVTINAPINGQIVQEGPVRQNVPYSLVVEYQYPSTFTNGSGQTVAVDPATIQPLGATASHYDFGSSTGDAFTSTVADRWAFARLERSPGSALNYVVVWNPQDYAVEMQLVAYLQDGRQITLPGAGQWRRIEATRREGFGIDDFSELGTAVFSAVLLTRVAPEANGTTDPAKLAVFEGVVAAVSAYRIIPGQEAAFGAIGDAEFGSRRGAITNLTQGNGVQSEIVIFNPNQDPATVTLSSRFIRTGLTGFSRQVSIGPGRSTVINASTLGITPGQPVGITYVSNLAVSVQSVQFQRGDADASSARYAAGNRFLFGDAFIDARTAGRQYFETLWFYNPTNVSNAVTIRLVFFNNPNQQTATININLPANGFGEIRLHERQEILSVGGPVWFAIDASSALPFMVNLEHYDLFLGGGWAAAGVPFGIETPLDQFRS